MKRTIQVCSMAAALAFAAGCSDSPETPLSPTGIGGPSGLSAAADGSTLKVSAPTPESPNAETLNTRRPTFTFGASHTLNDVPDVSLLYRVQVLADDAVVAEAVGQGSPIAIEGDLDTGRAYRWRVRAEFEGAFGPWSSTPSFEVSARAGTGGFGPTRSISIEEAVEIAMRVQREAGFDLGSGSSREERVAWLWASMAAVHYGHERFNPAGGDPNWCVKDAGGGRPPSDDVMVRCDSRDAWDTVISIGSDAFSFHHEHLGRLPGEQNVYPPPASALESLPK